ncbi:MAG: enoyl-CoA hydratase/isomerase family protein [Acidobacteriota bacterium]
MNQDSVNTVSLTNRGAYAILSMNRPDELNCLSESMLDGLEEAVLVFESWKDLRALVLTGSGDVFSVGADLKTIASLDAASAREFSRRGQRLMARLCRSDAVTIAAIDGYCLGGGLDLALSCDLRYATSRSSFQHPGVRRGIITGWGGSVRLPRLIGKDAARRYFITAERMSATDALRLGLLNGVVDDALLSASTVAATIGANWSAGQIAAAREAI